MALSVGAFVAEVVVGEVYGLAVADESGVLVAASDAWQALGSTRKLLGITNDHAHVVALSRAVDSSSGATVYRVIVTLLSVVDLSVAAQFVVAESTTNPLALSGALCRSSNKAYVAAGTDYAAQGTSQSVCFVLLDLATGVYAGTGITADNLFAMSASSDDSVLALAYSDARGFVLYDTADYSQRVGVPSVSTARQVALSADGRFVAVSQYSATKVYACADWTLLCSASIGYGGSADFSADGGLFTVVNRAWAAPGAQTYALSADSGALAWNIAADHGQAGYAYYPEGSRLIAGDTWRVLDGATAAPVLTLPIGKRLAQVRAAPMYAAPPPPPTPAFLSSHINTREVV